MNRPIRNLAVVLPFVLLGCASGGSSKPETATAPGADLAAYRTFGWYSSSDRPADLTQPQSILDANVRNAIRTQLIEKGYSETEDGPDIRISYENATFLREKTKSPMRIGVGVGSWGGNVGGGVGTSVPVGREGVVTEQETKLTIRAVDERKNQEVWVGSSTNDIKEGLDAGAVDKAVAGVLAKFPARRE